MNTQDNRSVRHNRTTDDGECAPLPPRSELFGASEDRFLSDRDIEVRTHASSLLSVSKRSKVGSRHSFSEDHLELTRAKLHRTPSGGRTWQNSSWDGKKMKSFIEESEDEPLQHSLPVIEDTRMNPPDKFIGRREKKRIVRTAALVGVVVFVVATSLGVGLSKKNESSSAASAGNIEKGSAQRMNDIVSFLSKGFSEPTSLATTGTPQHAAASWMANVDPLRYAIPTAVAGEDAYHFIQRYALAVLYFALGGQDWKFDLNFVGDQHECAWFESRSELTNSNFAAGVMCDSYLHVEDILIPGNNLSGKIPPELSLLTDLDFLSLERNNISGAFPTSLRNLTKLEYLNLNDNDLSGSMPSWLQELQGLRVLGLSNNELEGTIPNLNLRSLRTLALDGNDLTGVLSSVNALKLLKYVYLDDNSFTDVVDDRFLAELEGVVELGISDNKLSGSVPGHLFGVDTLLVLDLSNNILNGTFPDHIPQETNLEFLSIDGNNINTSGGIPFFVQEILDSSHTYERSPESFAF